MFLHALTQNNDSKKLLNHLVVHSLVFFNILGHFSLMCLLFFMETLNSYSLITPGAPPTARELLWKESLSPDIYHITMATRKQIFLWFWENGCAQSFCNLTGHAGQTSKDASCQVAAGFKRAHSTN